MDAFSLPLPESTVRPDHDSLLELYRWAVAFFLSMAPKTRHDYAMSPQCAVFFGILPKLAIEVFVGSLQFAAETQQLSWSSSDESMAAIIVPVPVPVPVPVIIPREYHSVVIEWLKAVLTEWSIPPFTAKRSWAEVFRRQADPIRCQFNMVIRSRSFKKRLLRERRRQFFACRDAHICIRREEDRIQSENEHDYSTTSEGAALLAAITELSLELKWRGYDFIKRRTFCQMHAEYKANAKALWTNSLRCTWVTACIAGGLTS